MKGDYALEDRLLEYSARILRLVERVPDSRAVRGWMLGVGCSTFLFQRQQRHATAHGQTPSFSANRSSNCWGTTMCPRR